MARQKVRIRFRKGGDLRLLSHHDLMRCFERMLRRAALPFHSTQGYNPKPRMVFALSLALGVVGCQEVVELELDEEVSGGDLERRLAEQAPAGLQILSVRQIDPKATAQVCRVCYRVALPAGARPADLAQRIDCLLAADSLMVERTRPERRVLDIKPFVRGVRLESEAIEIDMAVTPRGGARPEEVLGLLRLAEILEEGAVLERTLLELRDEAAGPESRDLGPVAAAGIES